MYGNRRFNQIFRNGESCLNKILSQKMTIEALVILKIYNHFLISLVLINQELLKTYLIPAIIFYCNVDVDPLDNQHILVLKQEIYGSI